MWYVVKCKCCQNCLCAKRSLRKPHKQYVYLHMIDAFAFRFLLQILSVFVAIVLYVALIYLVFSRLLQLDCLSEDTYCTLFVSGGAFILYVEHIVRKILFLTVEGSSTDSK